MRKKYTLREICEIENIEIPYKFMEDADEEITIITCFGSRMRKGGALFPRGLTENGKESSKEYNERSAFNYCISLTEMKIPDSVTTIGARAFYECTNLKKIIIGENVKFIDKEAFEKCPEITIYCKENSYAHNYAKANNLSYKFIKPGFIKLLFHKFLKNK